MKRQFKNYFSQGGLVLALLMVLCAFFGVVDGGSAMTAAATVTDMQGTHIPGTPANVPNNMPNDSSVLLQLIFLNDTISAMIL